MLDRIVTPRLVLRRHTVEDAIPLADAFNDRAVLRNIGPSFFPFLLDDADGFIRYFIRNRSPQEHDYAIEYQGRLIGGIGFFDELGYWLATEVHSRGFGTEAARWFLAHELSRWHQDVVDAFVYTDNYGSKRVLDRLGFETYGTIENNSFWRPKGARMFDMAMRRDHWERLNGLRLRSERLELRPLQPSDWRGFQAICSDHETCKMLASVPHPLSEADAKAWLKKRGTCNPPSRTSGTILAICLRNGPMIGFLGCAGDPATVLYCLDKEHWGRGYTTEAMKLFLADFVPRHGIKEMVADAFVDNPVSQRVLLKLGFQEIGRVDLPSAARDAPAPGVKYRWRNG